MSATQFKSATQANHHADTLILTCHEPGGAVGSKLVPEAAEKVQELERAQACGAGCEGGEGHSANEEEHKHHDEANVLHAAAAVPARKTVPYTSLSCMCCNVEEEEHKHHDEANVLHAAAAVPAHKRQYSAVHKIESHALVSDGRLSCMHWFLMGSQHAMLGAFTH
jgi:hypothetical protein